MSATLDTLLARLRTRLRDAGGDFFDDALLTEALRQALEQLNQVAPQIQSAELALPDGSGEISLAALDGLLDVLDVHWPYAPGQAAQPFRAVAGWTVRQEAGGPVLALKPLGRLPQAGDPLRLWYTRPHSLAGLDGAAATTLPARQEGLLLGGAAGLAAVSQALERSETLDPPTLLSWGQVHRAIFNAGLESLRAGFARAGQPWQPGVGWTFANWEPRG